MECKGARKDVKKKHKRNINKITREIKGREREREGSREYMKGNEMNWNMKKTK